VTLSAADVQAIVGGAHGDPFAVLGPHLVHTGDGPAVAVRAFLPVAEAVRVIPLAPAPHPQKMGRIHPDGLFEAVFASRPKPFAYRLEVADHQGHVFEIEDPYRFSPTLNVSIGMSYLPVELAQEGTEVEVDVRGKPLRAAVVPRPFYRRKQPKTKEGS